MTTTHHNIGLRLRQRREALGWTLDDASKKSGYCRPVINRIELGQVNFIFTTLIDLCDCYELELKQVI